MRWMKNKPLAWVLLTLLLPSWCWAPVMAQASTKSQLLRSTVAPGDRLIADRTDGSRVAGSFRDLRRSDSRLVLDVYDPARSRFSPQEMALNEVVGLRHVTSRKSAAYPVLGLLAGGTLGAVAGYLAGDNGRSGSDVPQPGNRGLMAFYLGLTGAVTGFLTGAVLAPAKTTEATLW